MTDAPSSPEGQPAAEATGTYELLRGRLEGHAEELARRAAALNTARTETFGSTELAVAGSERIRTENNCVPVDIAGVGGSLLFGYNVFIGIRTETRVSDVFSLHRFEHGDGAYTFTPVDDSEGDGSFLTDERFVHDFHELYQYYKDSKLVDLRMASGKLLAVFQTGGTLKDIRVFRWQVSPDGAVRYLDARGERDYTFPPKYDFEWTAAGRANYTTGRRPMIDILDEVFIEPTKGTLDFKVEDNTDIGKVVLSEPVQEREQSLADCEVAYAKVGSLVLLRVLPYRESSHRYYVFNTLTRRIDRIDAVGQSCQQLPEDHGVIFPGGYYLQGGDSKTFDTFSPDGMEFEEVVRSPNGEDVLYVFHRRDAGTNVLLPYNLIRKEVGTPIFCHGFSLFDDGTLVVFRDDTNEPTRVHHMQVWATPFESAEHHAQAPQGTTFFHKVGNADLVRGISDALSIRRAATAADPSVRVYEDLIASAVRASDDYYWYSAEEAGRLDEPLAEIIDTAKLIVGEFEKVEELKAQAAKAVDEAASDVADLLARSQSGVLDTTEQFTEALSGLRRTLGHLVTIRDIRYADTARVAALEQQVSDEFSALSVRTVDFLSGDQAFAPFHERAAALSEEAAVIAKVADAPGVGERLDSLTADLEMLTEVVSGLDVDDATVRTGILRSISEVLAATNRGRAILDGRRNELLVSEQSAEFAAEFSLLSQTVSAALTQATTPEKADEQLARIMVHLENLEGRFGESEEAAGQLADKRDEVYETFSARKQSLLDDRQRRAARTAESAARILQTVTRRSSQLASADEVNAYFASDPMVAKVKKAADDLRGIGEVVKADEIDAALKTARQEASRSLRDRQDIFEGDNVIRFGKHRFSVNTQPLELSLAPSADGIDLVLSGTDFRRPVDDADFDAYRPFWEQAVVSESSGMYRGEYLAMSVLSDAAGSPAAMDALTAAAGGPGGLAGVVRTHAESHYDEGYELGVHDHDAALILEALLRLRPAAGMLRFDPAARSAAQLYWQHADDNTRLDWHVVAMSLDGIRRDLGATAAVASVCGQLTEAVTSFLADNGVEVAAGTARRAGEYLFEELTSEGVQFVQSEQSLRLYTEFLSHLDASGSRRLLDNAVESVDTLAARHRLVTAWVDAFVAAKAPEAARWAPEVVAAVLTPDVPRVTVRAETSVKVTGVLGQHPLVKAGKMTVAVDDLNTRFDDFVHDRVPAFRAYQKARGEVLARRRKAMRLSEYEPKVMSAFVRNRLINDVYLPLIGDNLAKQVGTVGDDKRTDQSGMLLLISPPGYGKTTLMEYVADRLGMVFVKVNGPALGHSVTSLDPADAPNATARQEVEKINFALEMGNNVILYLDDIQHTSPELLQKFISLADSTRRIEGVWDGETRTYDMRGKRFAVCMAGNPYTESGEKFRIPDMLANRADVYNLGDILNGRDDLFALSYIENSLTSNPALAPLSGRDPQDLYLLVRMADGEPVQPDQLKHPYTATELDEIVGVLKRLRKVQKVLLAVNENYILSAAQDDAYRTEPPFQLQGSYRNMNKLAAKVVAVMSDSELDALIDDHYTGEAQTLTTGAEHNLLKLAELRGTLTDEQAARWQDIKDSFRRRRTMGNEDDPMAKVAGGLVMVAEEIAGLRRSPEG